jgi:hypothetical protein
MEALSLSQQMRADVPPDTLSFLSGNINTVSPTAYTYSDIGVIVQPSAIRAPVIIYSSQPNVSQALNNLLSQHGTYLFNTTQYMPVMYKNPIQCRPGGILTIDSNNNQLVATLADRHCTRTIEYPFFNVATDNIMLNFMCTASGNDSIGRGTMVSSGTAAYGGLLASGINDRSGDPNPMPPHYTCVVTCMVNTLDVFTYRTVTLDLQGLAHVSQSSYGRVLSSSGQACTPVALVISNFFYGTAAAANWRLLSQNIGADGYFDILPCMTMGRWS